MPSLGSRSLAKDEKTLGRTLLSPYGLHDDHDRSRHASSPGLSVPQHEAFQRAASVDVARLEAGGRGRRVSTFMAPTPPSPPDDSRPHTSRFTLLRFRNASEPQLSAKAREQAAQSVPPVPAVPAAPAIITTAPTDELEDPPPPPLRRRRSKFRPFVRQKPSPKTVTDSRPKLDHKAGEERASKVEKRKSRLATLRLGRDDPLEELRKLAGSRASQQLLTSDATRAASTNATRAASTDALPLPDRLQSEQANVNGDYSTVGDHPDSSPPTPGPPPPRPSLSHTSFAWLPGRRNKNRSSLFPLPVNALPPNQHFPKPDSPRLSTNTASTRYSHDSPFKHGLSRPPLSALIAPRASDDTSGSIPPTSLPASSIIFAAPGSTVVRSNSLHSSPSNTSSPALLPQMGRRGRHRSSTLGSNGGISDDAPPPTPPVAAGSGSGRASTSTAGRSSMSNLFVLNRFRHSSDPHSPRQSSPGHGLSATPGAASHTNSLSLSREAVSLPERHDGETAIQYLARVEEIADKAQIPTLLSKGDDEFWHNVMRSFMRKFSFFGEPLDMSIRKLLMEIDLPKETQQIDRVIQGFADRYHECNPGIFAFAENAYFIAFSIIILHTDVFNKNNKRKMTKQDYIKNSAIDNVCEDVLECFYDNIVYTQFIRVEDDDEMKTVGSKRSKRTAKSIKNVVPEPARKNAKEPLDPYALMFENKLDILRPPIKDVMNLDDPFSYLGSAPSLDKSLLKASKIGILQIESSRSRPDAFMSPSGIDNPEEASAGIVELPVEKVGVLWRKDPKKKTARSPWQEWGAVLCSAGLYFFKNASWVKYLIHQYENHLRHGHHGTPVRFKPVIPEFKWNYMLPTDHGVALQDATYKRHKNAFVFLRPSGSEEVFLADSEAEMNDWLAKLNYQAAFKSAGVRQRGITGSNYDGQRQRALRRLESNTSAGTMQTIQTPTGEVTIQSGKIDAQLAQEISIARQEIIRAKIVEGEEKLADVIRQIDSQLRDARHLLILAPIQPKTREQLVHAAGRMAARLKWMRIELWRMKCHRDILAMDLEEERKETQRRQARIDKVSGKAPPSITSESSTSTAKAFSNGIERLHSNASSGPSPPRGHPSPVPNNRSETKMSNRFSMLTDADNEIFTTPAASPRVPPESEFGNEPLTIKALPPNRTSLLSSNRSPGLLPYNNADEPLESPTFSEYRTPMLDDEAAERRRSIIGLGAGSMDATPPQPQPVRPDTASDSEREADAAPALTGSPGSSRSKVRRSLQRTLRESGTGGVHGLGHHQRDSGSSLRRSSRQAQNKARGDSSSSTVLEDWERDRRDGTNNEGEGLLRREKGSFTVHGKKASVITFGAEWANMSAEERLKVRKQAHSSGGGGAAKPLSDLSSASAAMSGGNENVVTEDESESISESLEYDHARALRSLSVSEASEASPTARERRSSLGSTASENRINGFKLPPRRSSIGVRDRRVMRKSSSASASASLDTSSTVASPKPEGIAEEEKDKDLAVTHKGDEVNNKEQRDGDDERDDAEGKGKGKAKALDKVGSPKAQPVQA